MAGIVLATYTHLIVDGRMEIETAKIATKETLQDLYPHAIAGDITVATANAMACFIAWNRYLELKRGAMQ
jgi:predicted deacylase